MKVFLLCVFVIFLMPLGKLKAQNEALLLQSIEKESNKTKQADMMYQLGSLYYAEKGYVKALEYFEKALMHTESFEKAKQIKQNMIRSYGYLEQFDKAITMGENLLIEAKQQNDQNLRIQTLSWLSQYAQKTTKYESAKQYNQELWEIYVSKNDVKAKAITSNNLGVIYSKLANIPESEKWFEESITLNQRILQKEENALERTLTYINIGVTYTKLNQIDLANQHFDKALESAEGNSKAKATALNYSAMGQYLHDESAEAIRLALDAKQIATANNDSENIIHACQTLKMIYEAQNADKEAKEVADLAIEEQKKLDKQRDKEREQLVQKQLEIEKKEAEIKNTIAEAAKRDAQLRETKLEKEKREKEIENQKQALAILEQDKKLAYAKIKEQEAEQMRTKQLLEIAQQKAETDKQKAETERQKILVEKEHAENESKTKDLQAKERDLKYAYAQKKMQDAKLKQEQIIRYLGIGLILLIFAILFYVYRSLHITRKLNTQIKKQVIQLEEQKEKEKVLERDLAYMKIKNEKERIARDLHDNIGGQLTYLARTLASSPDEKLNTMIGNTIKELRNTVWAVQQAEVSFIELEDKIYNLIAQVETDAEIQIYFDLPTNLTLTSQDGLNIFRIVQEALQNAVKYSQATNIQIIASFNPQQKIVLQIIDNGIGFELEKAQAKKGHYGLSNMQARSELMNAYFEISSQVGKGTIIQVVINQHTA